MTEQRIAAGKVASIEYVLTDPSGKELDRSKEGEPLLYLHGARNIVPGLEEALAGKVPGDSLECDVPPSKGYGERQRMKTQKLMRSKFPDDAKVEKGARFMMQSKEGPFPVWIEKIMGRQVQITPQHPLAGVTLHFAVTVGEIRDATEEETAHGHPHGPGGHEHGDEAGAEAADEAAAGDEQE